MTFADWLAESYADVRENGCQGVEDAGYKLYVGGLRRLGRYRNFGESIYDAEWDLLVVLDACRADLMAEVAPEYDFVDDEWTYSVGSSSAEWMEKTFTPEASAAVSETVYVTANPFSETELDPNDFRDVDEVWRYAWDEDLGTVPADAVTDRAVAAYREHRTARLLVHYMQPHYPFVPNPLDEGISREHFGGDDPHDSAWEKLRRGEIDREVVWDAYADNLRYVLDRVEVLLENVEAETAVVTADHGNLVGEYGLYGHPNYVPVKALKRVPWCVTEAEDIGEYVVETEATDDLSISTSERLEHLGYKE